MKFVEDNDFNELVQNFKKLSTIEKKKLTITEIKRIIAVLNTMNTQKNHNSDVLITREILKLNETNGKEEEFVEAIYIYLYTIKELLGDLALDNSNNIE